MKDNHISYIEFRANDLGKIKRFYNECFGWTFIDYGPTYASFSESGLAGGFETTDGAVTNGALVVLYHHDLDAIKDKIIESGGRVSKDIFEFPGGKRFHFTDPDGNELAIWSDK